MQGVSWQLHPCELRTKLRTKIGTKPVRHELLDAFSDLGSIPSASTVTKDDTLILLRLVAECYKSNLEMQTAVVHYSGEQGNRPNPKVNACTGLAQMV